MTKHLHIQKLEVRARPKHQRKPWSAERRARQAARIQEWAPWRRSTGPKTHAGKLRCAQNALRHGYRSTARVHELRRVRHVLRLVDENLKVLRLLIQLRNAQRLSRIKYKPSYADRCPVARAQLALDSLLQRRKADLSRRSPEGAKADCRSR